MKSKDKIGYRNMMLVSLEVKLVLTITIRYDSLFDNYSKMSQNPIAKTSHL